MKRIILTLSILLSLAFATEVNAQQKFGHVNSQELFETMPEVKNLRAQLLSKSKQYENQLKTIYAQGEAIATDLQTNGQSYTQMVLEEKYAQIAAIEEKMGKIQAAAEQELARYEAEQLGPIEEKAFQAIKRVAQANGFTYIFDSSLGVLIYKPASDDITNMVKAELGIY